MSMTQGFWSYVHKDNDGLRGAIRRVANDVVDEYEVMEGDGSIDLFLDSAKIKWGDKWKDKIGKAIREGAFFIPIVTPRYLQSEECRNELLDFAKQAEDQGREGLIMPLYFVEVKEIEARDKTDRVVELLIESQMEDWRNLRLLDQSVQPYKLAINKLVVRLTEVARERKTEHAQPSANDDKDDAEAEPAPSKSDLESSTDMPPTLGGGDVLDVSEDAASNVDMHLLERLAAGEEALPRITDTLSAISVEINEVGTETSKGSEQIKDSDAKGGGFKGRLAVANALAHKLKKPADRLKQLSADYMADLLVLDPAMNELLVLAREQADEDPEAYDEFFTSVEGMINSSDEAMEQIDVMVKAMEQASKFSRELEKPLMQMRVALQSMIDGNKLVQGWREHTVAARG
jgi:hypothetical protein